MDGLLPGLAALHVVAQERHVGRAARRLGTSQPSLSQLLSRLEQRVGRRLVERQRGTVELTHLGRDVDPQLAVLLSTHERLFSTGGRIRRGHPDDRHLRAVVAVDEHASVTRAAVALGLSSSATSERVAAVERQLARPLFERRHGMRPRRDAEDLVRRIRAMVSRYDDVVATLVGRGPRLSIGFLTATDPPIAQRVVDAYRAGGAEVRLVRVFSDERTRLLRAGEVDAAFVRVPPDVHADLTGTQLDVDELVAALPATAPVGERRVGLAEVNALGLHWYVDGQNDWFEDRLAHEVARAGARLRIVGRSSGPFPNLTEVARGNGATLVSRSLSSRLRLDGVRYHELRESLPFVVLSLVHRRGDEARPELAALLDAARRTALRDA